MADNPSPFSRVALRSALVLHVMMTVCASTMEKYWVWCHASTNFLYLLFICAHLKDHLITGILTSYGVSFHKHVFNGTSFPS
jgi:hypothetical protein